MATDLSQTLTNIASEITQQSHNGYTLDITELTAPLSVLSVQANEQLDKPWRYEVTFTSPDKHIQVSSVLT